MIHENEEPPAELSPEEAEEWRSGYWNSVGAGEVRVIYADEVAERKRREASGEL